MNKLYNYLAKRGSFPTLITVLSSFIVALIIGDLSAIELFCILCIVSLQFYLNLYNRVYSSLIPVEELNKKNTLKSKLYFQKINWILSVSPLLLVINIYMPWLVFFAVISLEIRAILHILQRFYQKEKILISESKKLEELNPKIAVYVSGLEDVAYQINQWLPVLKELDQSVIIVVRQRGIYKGMHETEIPIIYAKNAIHVEQVLDVGIKTVLYPANPMQNLIALRHYKLNHYFINHGESDKAVNQNKLLLAYDKLLVGGPLAHRRMTDAGLKLRGDQVEYVGRPQAEMLLNKIDSTKIKKIKTILYAPTWEGFVEDMNYSSVSNFGLRILKDLSSLEYRLIFKPHPYTGSRNNEMRAYLEKIIAFCNKNGIEVVDSLVSIHHCMNQSDLLITDISSVLNEYLVTNKAMILCNVKAQSIENLNQEFPSSRAAYVLNPEDKVQQLLENIKQKDDLKEQRLQIRVDSLGDPSISALERFKEVISRSCQ